MDNLIGRRLDGRYLIQSLVGVGGMANVYRGVDEKTGNAIAVKVLKEEFLDNEELVRRFKMNPKRFRFWIIRTSSRCTMFRLRINSSIS